MVGLGGGGDTLLGPTYVRTCMYGNEGEDEAWA